MINIGFPNVAAVKPVVWIGIIDGSAMLLSILAVEYIKKRMNKNINSEVRATVLSTYGQIDALGQFIGGPLIGLIALKTSISAAIVTSGIILSPIIVLFIYILRRDYIANI